MPSSGKPTLAELLDAKRASIMVQFHNRCIRCNHKAVTVHEVEFRSSGFKSLSDECRVPLCHDCHEWAHQSDKSNRKEELLRLRKEALKRYETE